MPGEWLVEKHGTTKRRSWHKLHIGLDAVAGEIVASTLTGRDIDDGSQVAALLDQVDGSVGVFMGDGAYYGIVTSPLGLPSVTFSRNHR